MNIVLCSIPHLYKLHNKILYHSTPHFYKLHNIILYHVPPRLGQMNQEADEIAIVGLTIRVSLFAGLDYWAAVREELTN